MKIAVDAMGGDHAPKVVVQGAKDFLSADRKVSKLYLVGDESQLKALLERGEGGLDPRFEIVPSSEVVGMEESGAKSLRRKKQSSIAIATDLVKSGEAGAVISAGNTGAAVAAATLKLRLLEGIERAGIASPLPNQHGICNLLDAGANPEAKPAHLVGYAVMGAVFAREVLGVKHPKVGLMSNGEEDEKGTAFTKETFKILKSLHSTGNTQFDFLGNIEGHDLFDSEVHVALADGFTGNIILKSCEATAKAMTKWLRIEMKRSPMRMLGAAMSQGAFKAVKERGSYESVGGSPLLGVNGVCIIAHGSSSALAIKNAIRVGGEALKFKLNPKIEEAIAALK